MLEGAELAAWLKSREGKLTSSNMAKAMSFLKNGKPSAERSTYMREIVAERVGGGSVRHFVNDAMQWGLDHEAEALQVYEASTGAFVDTAGFYDHPVIDLFGGTPDGLLGHDGLIEIKCPTTPTFVSWVLAGVVPDEHKPQMIAQLLCTGRRYVEFVAFDPRIKDPKRRLFVRRYEPSAEEKSTVEAAAIQFLSEVDAMFEAFTATEPA